MDLLLAFLAGAVCAAALIMWVLRSRAGLLAGDPSLRELQQGVQRLEVGNEGVRAVGGNVVELLRQTSRLSQALGRPGVRGQWGEVTLRNVCEAAGMAEHIDFETQAYVRADADHEGAIRPDLVIRLPGGGHVCVDAKVPLDAFDDAAEQARPEDQAAALDRHVQQVRRQMRALQNKGYWKRLDRSPEMVVMFIASEAAFAAAVSRDPHLIEHAAQARVVIASPTTMLALLQVVALGWRQVALSESTEEIRALAAELVKRLGVVSGHLGNVSKALDRATREHNKAVSSYEGRLLVTARKLGPLGIAEAGALAGPEQVESAVRLPAVADDDEAAMPR
jgi:DNA recombination protein RmuC